ncbi:MAG: hypothetical protein IJL51_08730 [Oscillospiraceae bacterium]|nr:hypothetical protein [Oscillospiraceae bacterium]
MKPEENLHPLVYQSLLRYLGYGWNNALIQSLLRYRFNVKISQRCLNTFRKGGNCSTQCQSLCPFLKSVM